MGKLLEVLKQLGIEPMGSDTFLTVPESELAELENKIDGKLPPDYREFLKLYGKSLFKVGLRVPGSQDLGPIPFGFFYGANVSGNGLLANYQFTEGQFPRAVIPIGEDGVGNLFCIATAGPTRNHVYYWYHEIGPESDTDLAKYECLEKVATTFTEFVLSLREDSE